MSNAALTLQQPWAWAVIHAGKTVENRPWRIYRVGMTEPRWQYGTIVLPETDRFWIHAGKEYWEEDAHDIRRDHRIDVPGKDGVAFGAIIGSVKLVDIVRDADMKGSRYSSPWAFYGSYHWVLADPKPLEQPITIPGLQKLWNLDRQAHKKGIRLNGVQP